VVVQVMEILEDLVLEQQEQLIQVVAVVLEQETLAEQVDLA
tara:strand:+ start:503 stop:625 length:123 start_codon:yes stop_codon:yes gene_type:complete